MEFKRLSYTDGTGKVSKAIESYNFHKAAGALAEYGFDCIRLADDWQGADFLAHHKATGRTLQVQLKTCLVIDKKYSPNEDLYLCFPLDGTRAWYLIRHKELIDIVKENAPDWYDKYRAKGAFWHYNGRYGKAAAGKMAALDKLERFAYRPRYGVLGYREARDFKKNGNVVVQTTNARTDARA